MSDAKRIAELKEWVGARCDDCRAAHKTKFSCQSTACWKTRDEILAILGEKAALEDYEKVTARLKDTETWWRNAQSYGMRMEHSRNSLRGPLAQLKARAEKAEAELGQKEAHIKTILQDNAALKAELKAERQVTTDYVIGYAKLEAKLERQRPLIEAVMGAKLIWVAHPAASSFQPLIETRELDYIDRPAVLRAAAIYKEQAK